MATPTTEPAPPAGEAAGKPEAAAKAGGEAPAAGGAEAPAPGGKGGKASPFAATSLYVGDLDVSVSEAQLYEMFQQVGHVVSIRVCRDLITRRSLGYAYINFGAAGDAKQAIETLNYTRVNGRPIRIMYSQRDPSSRKSGLGNVFVKNLDKAVTNKDLHELFDGCGTILSAKVASDSSGNSKGYGFVQFDTDEAAKKAIDTVNGKMVHEKPVFVGPFVRKQERSTGSSSFSNIYVKNLGEAVTDEDLKKAFEEYGPTTSVVVMKDAEGKSRGFGFVNFEEPEHAAAAVEKLNGHDDGEKEWFVCRAQKKSEREAQLRAQFEQERKERAEKFAGANLYLKNLDDQCDDEKLRQIFGEFGTITSCRVMRDSQGASRGSGFVAFSSPEEATRAVTEMNGKMIGAKPLYVAIAQRKEDRQARLKAQFQQRPAMPPGMPGGMPMYPGAPGVPGAQMYFNPGMAPPMGGPMPGYPGVIPGMRPGPQGMPQYFVPMMQGRQPGRGKGPRGRGPMGPGRGGMRMPPQMRVQPEMPVPMPQPIAEPQAPSLAQQLAQADPDSQRMIIGEALYPLVEALEPQAAAKVTGMLLEMDQSEVLHLVEDKGALSSKVSEAMSVLRQAGQAPDADAVADGVAGLSVA